MASPEAGDHIRYGAAPDIQTGRDASVWQVTVKFKAQQFFNFTHPRFQSCHGDTSPEDGVSEESVVYCFKSEKRGIPTTGSPILTIRSRIPTDGQIWPEQIGMCDRITSESMVGLGRNTHLWAYAAYCRNTVYIENAINLLKKKGYQLLSHLSLLGLEHINLIGEYIWKNNNKLAEGKYRPLRGQFGYRKLLYVKLVF